MLSIADYTLRTWGETQTIRYIDELKACCQLLADSSNVRRAWDDIRPGLYRKEQGVFISRILHKRMLPRKHVFGDEDKAH